MMSYYVLGRALLAVLLHDQRRVGGQAAAGEPGRQLAQQRRALPQRHRAVGRQARRRRQRRRVPPGVLRNRRAQQLRARTERAGEPSPAHGCMVRRQRLLLFYRRNSWPHGCLRHAVPGCILQGWSQGGPQRVWTIEESRGRRARRARLKAVGPAQARLAGQAGLAKR